MKRGRASGDRVWRTMRQWQSELTNTTTDNVKQREVNTAAAQSRGLNSLCIDLKVCQTGPSNCFYIVIILYSNVSVQHKYSGFGMKLYFLANCKSKKDTQSTEQNVWGQMKHHQATRKQQSEQWSTSKLSRKRINTTKHIEDNKSWNEQEREKNSGDEARLGSGLRGSSGGTLLENDRQWEGNTIKTNQEE
jgi:hypothetical protein